MERRNTTVILEAKWHAPHVAEQWVRQIQAGRRERPSHQLVFIAVGGWQNRDEMSDIAMAAARTLGDGQPVPSMYWLRWRALYEALLDSGVKSNVTEDVRLALEDRGIRRRQPLRDLKPVDITTAPAAFPRFGT